MTARHNVAATTIGDAVVRTCQSAGRSGRGVGQVVGTFSSGFYVRAEGALFAVAGPRVAAGPIHLVLEGRPPPPRERSIVRLAPDRLCTGSCVIDLSRADGYRPTQPSPARLRTIAPALARLDHPGAPPEDIVPVWAAVRAAVERSALHAARTLLEGLGGGLTPTGDDVLAGLLLFAHWADPESAVPGEVAQQTATTDLSRSFLAWAAAGQSIQPVHDLLDAAELVVSSAGLASASTAQDQFDHVAADIASVGHSSGQGLLAGLGLAATAWPMR